MVATGDISLVNHLVQTLIYIYPCTIFPDCIVNKFLILTDMTTLSPANTLIKLSNQGGFFLGDFTSNSLLMLGFRLAGFLALTSLTYIHLRRKQVTD